MCNLYSGDPEVDSHHHIFITSCNTTKIHTLLFPTVGLTRSLRDFVDRRNCMDPHGRVVSYLLTFRHSPSRIQFGCRERCGRMFMVGSLPSSSVVLPQLPPSG